MAKPPRTVGATAAAAHRRRPNNWRQRFLDALAESSNVAGAARKARVDVSTVYKARRAEPEFSAAWFSALCEGYDNLEMELLRRLRSGETEKPDAKRKRKHDNPTAFRLLSAHRESVKRERGRREASDERAVIASINAKLDLMREREQELARLREEEKEQTRNTPADPGQR